MLTAAEIEERIAKCIAQALKIDIEKVLEANRESPLNTIGMDSLNCMDIVINIEMEFGIAFIDDELLIENLNTFKKLQGIVGGKVA